MMENDTQLQAILFPVVLAEQYPYGIICPECGHHIRVGQPYHNVPQGMTDGVVRLHMQCVYCS